MHVHVSQLTVKGKTGDPEVSLHFRMRSGVYNDYRWVISQINKERTHFSSEALNECQSKNPSTQMPEFILTHGVLLKNKDGPVVQIFSCPGWQHLQHPPINIINRFFLNEKIHNNNNKKKMIATLNHSSIKKKKLKIKI